MQLHFPMQPTGRLSLAQDQLVNEGLVGTIWHSPHGQVL